ncbi:hypothetical protein FRC12_007950 [Ceratobasidium sp. 428]|nr:hypothetical protein FRC12_007950 [Ceratobasidium sp. 428]
MRGPGSLGATRAESVAAANSQYSGPDDAYMHSPPSIGSPVHNINNEEEDNGHRLGVNNEDEQYDGGDRSDAVTEQSDEAMEQSDDHAETDHSNSDAESREDSLDSDVEPMVHIINFLDNYSPIPSPSPPPPPPDRLGESPELVYLHEIIDQHGHREYIEQYNPPTVGEPIRPATHEEMGGGDYPDVGALSDPDCFEIAKVLMQSGMSVNY